MRRIGWIPALALGLTLAAATPPSGAFHDDRRHAEGTATFGPVVLPATVSQEQEGTLTVRLYEPNTFLLLHENTVAVEEEIHIVLDGCAELVDPYIATSTPDFGSVLHLHGHEHADPCTGEFFQSFDGNYFAFLLEVGTLGHGH